MNPIKSAWQPLRNRLWQAKMLLRFARRFTLRSAVPQGHLLQGDEAHMGMQTQCPQCGVLFIIPTVVAPSYPIEPEQALPPSPEVAGPPDLPPQDAALGSFLGSLGQAAANEPVSPSPAMQTAPPPPAEPPKLEADPRILHIPCPNGHELETPIEMLGQDALCPHCKAQFHLRREDSIEAQREQELRDQRRAEAWLRWSIAAAVIVVIGLIAMIVMSHLD